LKPQIPNKFGTKSSGLGDTLLLTSVCKYFPNQFTIQIPESRKRFSILFEGLAKTEITKDEEINELPNVGFGHYATRKLRNFFGSVADGLDNRPLVLYSDMESEKWAFEFLKDKPNPIIFVPTCSKQWAEVRDIPNKILQNLLEFFKNQSYTPIICQSSSNLKQIDGVNLVDLDLKKYICLLRRVGIYVGANTGDEHLATSLGCAISTYQPKDSGGFSSEEWNYTNLNSKYFIWDDSHKS